MSAPDSELEDIFTHGEIELQGEFLWGSNYTFLVDVKYAGESVRAVYKPARGERPLWDFPRKSLAHREVAAYLVSEALSWELVPLTVYRRDGPAGSGSLQLFIEHDPDYHYFTFSPQDRQRLRPVVLFDYLINNADRKASHVLVDARSHIWLIDHGICFHTEDKLRTVIWDFCDEPVPAGLREDLRQLYFRLTSEKDLPHRLADHLSPAEIAQLTLRAEWLSRLENFPGPPSDRRVTPWPPL